MSIDLASLALSPAGTNVGARPDAWLRASIDVAGVQHFVDLVAVRVGRHGVQHALSKDLDAMVRLHHLACGPTARSPRSRTPNGLSSSSSPPRASRGERHE